MKKQLKFTALFLYLSSLFACAGGQKNLASDAIASNCGMNFRWLSNAGFELELRSGAHVLIDPWLDSATVHKTPLDSIARADYVLVTHIHYDHAQDVGAIQKKFPYARIFTGMLSAEPLAKWQKLDTSRLYKVTDNQEFRFDDVTFKAIAGRHTESNRGNYPTWDDHGHMTPDSMGLFDLYQFMVTDADGTKFLVWGGTPSVDNAYRMTGLRPQIAAVHISPKQDFGMMARMLIALEPKVMMPHHYDIWPTILRSRPGEAQQFPAEVQPVTPENVVEKTMGFVNRQLSDRGVKAAYHQPVHGVWYHYDPVKQRVEPGSCKRGA